MSWSRYDTLSDPEVEQLFLQYQADQKHLLDVYHVLAVTLLIVLVFVSAMSYRKITKITKEFQKTSEWQNTFELTVLWGIGEAIGYVS